MRPLLGMETEYAFSAFDAGGSRIFPVPVALLMAAARQRYVHVSDGGPGIFLGNGSRFYVDAGDHPELSTPECTDPRQVVRWALAGERMLMELAHATRGLGRIADACFFRSNVDYKTGATWGCHESYLHRLDPELLAGELVPHLVSRVIYTGAGGFDNTTGGLDFMVSPRAAHLRRVMSPSSTDARGIFHTKNEPLCSGGFSRLHVLAGESLASELGNLLKLGVTALIVGAIENGVRPGTRTQLASPVAALQTFARDPACRDGTAARSEGWWTAVEIQRVYLEAVESSLGEPTDPCWAERVCRAWRETLDALARDPAELGQSLDWRIKLDLFRHHAARRGVDFEAQAFSPHRAVVRDDRPAPPALRDELFELDTRLGELGPSGLFQQLDAAGVLAHAIDDLGDVDEALTSAPPGRPERRAAWIESVQDERQRHVCSWECALDRDTGRMISFGEPLGDTPPPPCEPRRQYRSVLQRLLFGGEEEVDF